MKMNFDIVIPTMNRPEDLERLIDSISRSTELPQKVIIIDQSKNTPKFITSELFEVHHINTTDVSGLTAARNKGVQYCNSDIIHFLMMISLLIRTILKLFINILLKILNM